ncbi:non-ribosomal peptide synthetase [Paraburkholderia hayleyella]|uniref:non-ribosomal peptide synthetase n=1 Tax=Paraburkholderia hayleyella TaxID=2152889 RepID=UPI0012915F9C|nr:non-ribosomal peptide synthetase [Paraburkholderia hayleyella]
MKATPDLLALASRFAQLPKAQRALFMRKLDAAGIDFRLLPIPPRARRTEPVPASFAQSRLWLHARIVDEAAAYHVSGCLQLDGPLDAHALRYAFDALIARHEALRTTFEAGLGGGVQQHVHAPMRCPWRSTDLGALPEAERQPAAQRIAASAQAEPFDLARDPLLRVHLLSFSRTAHRLVLTLHHIVADGWSMDVLLDELALFYRAYAQGVPVALAPLAVQYADYALWQRRWLEAGEGERQLAFWRTQVSPEAGVLALPGSRPRPTQRSARGGRHDFGFEADLARQVRVLADAERVTPFAVLLAALHAWLARACGESQIQVGVPAANRERPETTGLIGFFVNTLVVSVRVAPHMTFRALLQAVQLALVEGQSHQDVPFEQVVETLGVARSTSHHPLFQVMASYAVRRALPALGEVRVSERPGGAPYAKFDLALGLEEREDGALDAVLVYATDLFDAATIAELAAQYTQLVTHALAQPGTRISELEWLSPAQQRQLQVWNTYEAGDAQWSTVQAQIARMAQAQPDALAVNDASGSLTRAELDTRAERLARRLVAAGVRAETRVGIAVGRSTELFVGLLAILKAGGAFVPLDPSHPRERLAYIVADAGIDHVVTQRRYVPQLPLRPGVRVWLTDAIETGESGTGTDPDQATPLPVAFARTQAAYLIYTSGSTGKPKGVVVEHGALAMHIAAIVARYGLNENDRVLLFMSINFDGAHECWMAPLTLGISLRITDDALWSPGQTCQTMADEGVTLAAFPPGYAVQMGEWASQHGAPPALRSLTVGGEATSREAFAALRRAFPRARIVNGYGPTETVITPLLWMIDAEADASGIAAAYLPIGTPVGERTAHVLDAQLQPLPPGVTGELYLGGTGLARGYHARAALTAERFIPDPLGAPGARLYQTGDLVRRNADGVLEFVGRIDHQVKLRGLRIELGEIEARLAAHDAVRDAVALVRGQGSEALLVAYVELSEQAARCLPQVDGEALAAHLRRTLPDYMVPAQIVVMEALPRNANRKIDRAALPAPVRVARAYVAPAAGAETALARIWCEVLGVERVGRADHFFELGGHSLAAVSVAMRVAERLGHEVAVRALFEAPTLDAYTQHVVQAPRVALVSAHAEAVAEIEAEAQSGSASGDSVPLSEAQRALWFLWRNQPESAAYNIPLALRVRGALNLDALRAAFEFTAHGHPVLRATLMPGANGVPRLGFDMIERIALTYVGLDDQASFEEREAQALRLTDADALQPFDLYTAPLWRARVLRLDQHDHVLSIVIHHIIADGQSLETWLDDLHHAYGAALRGEVLQPKRVGLAGSAGASHPAPMGRTARDMPFWRTTLDGLKALPLPRAAASACAATGGMTHSDAADPAPQWQAGRFAFAFDTALTSRARALAQHTHATLPMLFHAVLNAALLRLTGVHDQAIGVLASLREPGEDKTLGLFINAVVVRTRMPRGVSPLEVLALVRDAALDAYAHASTPFAQVVQALRAERAAHGNPLFQVMFNYMRPAVSGVRHWEGLTLEGFNEVRHRVVFDLELDLVEHPDGRVTGAFSYAREKLDEHFVLRLMNEYLALAERFIEAPRERVDILPVDAVTHVGASVEPATALALPGVDARCHDLQRLAATAFGHTTLTPETNLFEAGASSFDVVRFVDAAQAEGHRLSIADVFRHQTLASLARWLVMTSAKHRDSAPLEVRDAQ